MGWEAIAGNWREMKGRIRVQWGKLTDDDLDRIEGRREQLLGTLQQRYGKARDVLDREVRDFERVEARMEGRRGAGDEHGGKGTGLEGRVGTSGRTGAEAGGNSAGRVRGDEGAGYAEPSGQREQMSGSRGADGRSGVGGGERGGDIEGDSSYSQGANEEDRG